MQKSQIEQFAVEEAQEINALWKRVKQRCATVKKEVVTACTEALEIGERLIKIKDTLAHGQFISWMKQHLDFTPRWGQVLMKVAKAKRTSHLSDEMSHRALMVELGIIPSQPHAPGRALNNAPDVYAPLNTFNRYLAALPSSSSEIWRTDPAERAAMRQQYLPLRSWLDELFAD